MNKPLYEQMNIIDKDYVLSKLEQFLLEDSPNGDPTTELTVDIEKNASASVICEDECVFAGEQILNALDDDFQISIFTKDGTDLLKGQKIATLEGNARQLLKHEYLGFFQMGYPNTIEDMEDIVKAFQKILNNKKALEEESVKKESKFVLGR